MRRKAQTDVNSRRNGTSGHVDEMQAAHPVLQGTQTASPHRQLRRFNDTQRSSSARIHGVPPPWRATANFPGPAPAVRGPSRHPPWPRRVSRRVAAGKTQTGHLGARSIVTEEPGLWLPCFLFPLGHCISRRCGIAAIDRQLTFSDRSLTFSDL